MRDINYLKSNGVDVDKSLELFGDINTYNQTIGELVISLKEKIDKLNGFKNSKDMYNYSIYAHSLKSDAKNFGFIKLGDFAYEHESKASVGDLYYIESNFEKLVELVDSTIRIIKEYLNGNNSDIAVSNSSEDKSDLVLSKETILVADDSNIIRNFVKRIFDKQYMVVDAKDGQEALDIIISNLNNDNIVCILLDLNMPNVDGFKVLDYMKEKSLFSKMPVSIISGDSSKDTIDRAFTYDIVDMIEKPFNEQSIKSIVEKTIYVKSLN